MGLVSRHMFVTGSEVSNIREGFGNIDMDLTCILTNYELWLKLPSIPTRFHVVEFTTGAR